MASKFQIDIKPPTRPQDGPSVRMVDDDQDETTGWIKLAKRFSAASDDEAFAAALLKSEVLQQMTFEAQQVAYAVYLGDDDFDIHRVNLNWAQALVDGVALGAKTPKPKTRSPGRRM